MVHALLESWRVLESDGALVDMRPYHANPPIEIIAGEQIYIPGRIDDSGGKADDIAADRAMAEAVKRGYFTPQLENTIIYADYWESLDDLLAHADESWRDHACIPPFVVQAARLCVAGIEGAYRVRIRRPLQLSVYRKQEVIAKE